MVKILLLLTCALTAFASCKVVGKAGYAAWFGLFVLVPGANVALLLMLAFDDWPIEQEVRRLRGD